MPRQAYSAAALCWRAVPHAKVPDAAYRLAALRLSSCDNLRAGVDRTLARYFPDFGQEPGRPADDSLKRLHDDEPVQIKRPDGRRWGRNLTLGAFRQGLVLHADDGEADDGPIRPPSVGS